jgi:hypothetical protein
VLSVTAHAQEVMVVPGIFGCIGKPVVRQRL